MKIQHSATNQNDRKKYMVKGCARKNRYEEAADAQEAVDDFYRRVVISIYPFVSYRCEIHGCFHVGHQRPVNEVMAFNRMLKEIRYFDAA